MRLGASVAFAFNSLAQGPVTRRSCRRRESNPGPQDSCPDALATLPPRFAPMVTVKMFRPNIVNLARLTNFIDNILFHSLNMKHLHIKQYEDNNLLW